VNAAVRERVALHAYRGVGWLGRTLPERAGRTVFGLLASIGYRFASGTRATVTANQAQVLGLPPEDPRVVASTREAFRLYARYWQDTFLGTRWSDEEVLERVECVGYERPQAALELGKGVIAALPHMGNWDLAGRLMAALHTPVVSVAEELEPPELFDFFVEMRRQLRMEILGHSSNGQVGRQLASALSRNRFVALVADRDLNGRGIEVEMFGRTRRMPAGPALLSISSGAPLIPAPVYTTERGCRVQFHEPLEFEPSGERKRDVVALTRKLAAAFERAIAAAPADWHMFQPGWES
jgi:phosphatidylinositol dimannoside acyltransferase